MRPGQAGSAGIELRGLLGTPVGVAFRAGYGIFSPSDDWVDDLSMLGSLLSVSYRQPLTQRWSIAPYAGAGLNLVAITAPESRADYEAGESDTNMGTQFVFEAGIAGEFAFSQRISAELRPAYRLLAEIDELYHVASVSLGISFKVLELDLFGRRAKAEAALAAAAPVAAGTSVAEETPAAGPMPDAETALARPEKEPNIRIVQGAGELTVIVEGSFNKNNVKLEDKTKAQLDLVGAVIRDLKPEAIRVDGYVAKDQLIGTDKIVSTSRAEVVRDWLLSSVYLAGRPIAIEARGLGRANPVGDNETEEGRSRNRRVEIVLTMGEGQPR